jgi:hypothetical protein
MVVAVGGLRFILLELGVPAGVRLALCIAAGVATYVPAALTLAPELRAEASGLRRRGAAPVEG